MTWIQGTREEGLSQLIVMSPRRHFGLGTSRIGWAKIFTESLSYLYLFI